MTQSFEPSNAEVDQEGFRRVQIRARGSTSSFSAGGRPKRGFSRDTEFAHSNPAVDSSGSINIATAAKKTKTSLWDEVLLIVSRFYGQMLIMGIVIIEAMYVVGLERVYSAGNGTMYTFLRVCPFLAAVVFYIYLGYHQVLTAVHPDVSTLAKGGRVWKIYTVLSVIFCIGAFVNYNAKSLNPLIKEPARERVKWVGLFFFVGFLDYGFLYLALELRQYFPLCLKSGWPAPMAACAVIAMLGHFGRFLFMLITVGVLDQEPDIQQWMGGKDNHYDNYFYFQLFFVAFLPTVILVWDTREVAKIGLKRFREAYSG
jgi:hypothetical protein